MSKTVEYLFWRKLAAAYPDHPWLKRADAQEAMMTNYDPNAKYADQPWHTVDTLRALVNEKDEQITQMYAERGAGDYLDRIEHTPNAWRIYGTIDSLIAKGYDADHIVTWLLAGEAAAERET